jgi:hypothetical protein
MAMSKVKKSKAATPVVDVVTGEPVEVNPEYEAGYNAFMRRCAYYCLAHSEDMGWESYWEAAKDDRPETPAYVEGWTDAKERIRREAWLDMGGAGTPRNQTAVVKAMQASLQEEIDAGRVVEFGCSTRERPGKIAFFFSFSMG